MSGRTAARILAGGLGVALGLVFAVAAVAAVLVALGHPADSRATEPPATTATEPSAPPHELVIALSLGDPVMQAGAVRDGQVIVARGFEVDVARELARRLGVADVRFAYVSSSARLLAAKERPWSLTIASIPAGRAVAAVSDLSNPYLATDQAVVMRRDLPPLSSLRQLRGLMTCAVRGSAGARALAGVVHPTHSPVLAPTGERLRQLVRTGACDAALVESSTVGRFVAGIGPLLGPVRARVPFGGGYVVSVTRGGPVAVADVNRALARMRADGSLHRIARTWLQIDPARLRVLS